MEGHMAVPWTRSSTVSAGRVERARIATDEELLWRARRCLLKCWIGHDIDDWDSWPHAPEFVD